MGRCLNLQRFKTKSWCLYSRAGAVLASYTQRFITYVQSVIFPNKASVGFGWKCVSFTIVVLFFSLKFAHSNKKKQKNIQPVMQKVRHITITTISRGRSKVSRGSRERESFKNVTRCIKSTQNCMCGSKNKPKHIFLAAQYSGHGFGTDRFQQNWDGSRTPGDVTQTERVKESYKHCMHHTSRSGNLNCTAVLECVLFKGVKSDLFYTSHHLTWSTGYFPLS